jgi:hypothetical protein
MAEGSSRGYVKHRAQLRRWCDTLGTTTPRLWEWDSNEKGVILSKGSVRNSLSFELILASGHRSCPGSLYDIVARVLRL